MIDDFYGGRHYASTDSRVTYKIVPLLQLYTQ